MTTSTSSSTGNALVDPAHSSISKAAKMVAYIRKYAGIPHAAEISDLSNSEAVFKEVLGDEHFSMGLFAALILRRYCALDTVVNEQLAHFPKGPPNIIDLGARLTPRGLIWTQGGYATYLETDLPDVVADKKHIVCGMLGEIPRPELRWAEFNAVTGDYAELAGFFPNNGPMFIISEWLCQYFDRAERAVMGKKLQRFLSVSGGFYATPDLSIRMSETDRAKIDPSIMRMMAKLEANTGVNLHANAFESSEERVAFYEGMGFSVETFDQYDLTMSFRGWEQELLESDADRDQFDLLTRGREVVVLKPKN